MVRLKFKYVLAIVCPKFHLLCKNITIAIVFMIMIDFMKVKWNLNSYGIAQNMLEQHVPSRKIFDVHVHEIVNKIGYLNSSFIIGGKSNFDFLFNVKLLNCLS
jgi:hypothetical protein